MMFGNTLTPAYVPPPGEILRMELDARGWTQTDLSQIMGKPPQAISEIVNAKKRITPETAIALAKALGTSPELWHNLEANYQLYLAREQTSKKEISDISRRGRLYELAPIRELVKRQWISGRESVDEMEREVCQYLDLSSPQENPSLAVSLRHSEAFGPEVAAQVAWLRRVQHLARLQQISTFDPDKLSESIPEILSLSYRAEDVIHVPGKLIGLGVHFLIVPHLPKTYVDGAALYIDDEHPVVALTLRHNRIDNFWFTLMHEVAHIVLGHKGVHINEENGDSNGEENEANNQAGNWLIPPEAFRIFVENNRNHFTQRNIEMFARSIHRNPGIVVGRLKHEEQMDWSHHRQLQVSIREHLTDWIDVASPRNHYIASS